MGYTTEVQVTEPCRKDIVGYTDGKQHYVRTHPCLIIHIYKAGVPSPAAPSIVGFRHHHTNDSLRFISVKAFLKRTLAIDVESGLWSPIYEDEFKFNLEITA